MLELMKVAFHINQFSLRGTEVATFDYADFNERLLGNDSVIVAPLFNRRHSPSSWMRFKERFKIRFYARPSQVDAICRAEKVDAIYVLKGFQDGFQVEGVRNLVHAVFSSCEPHGDRFATISPFLSRVIGNGVPEVPHIVNLPAESGHLRELFGIPAGATVIGRHGGYKTFDLPFVHEVVYQTLQQDPNLYYIFLNTRRFGKPHPRILHLRGTADVRYKIRFINTCDLMLHAREEGETFGLAIAEFSVQNKPVLTWSGSEQRAHIEFLGDRGLYYADAPDLASQIAKFDRNDARNRFWDVYTDRFSPSRVMKRFSEVFLDA